MAGGGNSAGQAVVFLAPKVKRLNFVVRGVGLEATMSRYLVERISALPNVQLHPHTEIASLEGDHTQGLTGAVFLNRENGEQHRRALRHLSLFIGADPNSSWLQSLIDCDPEGFIKTGQPHAGDGSAAAALETNIPNLFAIGDVRAGSTKRVAAAVGEGAAVAAQVHGALTRREEKLRRPIAGEASISVGG